MADPDLQIRGGGRGEKGSDPDPEIRGGGGVSKKIRGRPRPPGPSPRSATVYYMAFLAVVPKKFRYASIFLSVTYKSKES